MKRNLFYFLLAVAIPALFCSCENKSTTSKTPEDGIYYYIKHSWGSGADKDWDWCAMNYIGNNVWKYTGKWGGMGANIHTSPDDTNAQWFPMFNDIFTIGSEVDFYYYSKSKYLQVYTKGQNPNKTDKGRIAITNSSKSNYQITLTGATSYNATIRSGYYLELNDVITGYYVLHYKQLNGYLLYPTEGDFKFTVKKDSTQPCILE